MTTPSATARALLGSPYQDYLYAYPHKSAYRPLDPRPHLRDVWAEEDRSAVFGYVHIPFCEMRCGFCNLFTRTLSPAQAPDGMVAAYLRQLATQAERTLDAIGPVTLAAGAIGGGTPTYLDPSELETLFAIWERTFPRRAGPLSVETSPATATRDRLDVLAAYGTTRISLGVQSFVEAEAHAAGRPQHAAVVDAAVEALMATPVPTRSIDLIFGIDGQTEASWRASLRRVVELGPEEVYCYPLYVRPLTGLGRATTTRAAWDEQRLRLYAVAVEVLGAAGYRRHSLRHFAAAGPAPVGDAGRSGGPYSCQDDPMIGLGCGARSYTRGLHYSFDYAVGVRHVRAILDDYLAQPAAAFDLAHVGITLDEAEQRRRWVIKSLLQADGLARAAYATRFPDGPPLEECLTGLVDASAPRQWVDVAGSSDEGAKEAVARSGAGRRTVVLHGLDALADAGLVASDAERVRLTREGLAWSDAIGAALVSPAVRRRMEGFDQR